MNDKLEVIKSIAKEMKDNGTFNLPLEFACFADGIFTYTVKMGDTLTEINIIANDVFLKTESANDVLHKSGLRYLSHAVFYETDTITEELGRLSYDAIQWIG